MFDAPGRAVGINPHWAAALTGLLMPATVPGWWSGMESDTERAAQEVARLVSALFDPSGVPNNMRTIEIDITAATAYPAALGSIGANEVVTGVEVSVLEVWDAGTLTIGTASAPADVADSWLFDLSEVALFDVSPEYRPAAPAALYAFIAGTPTTGAMRVVLTIYQE